MNWLGAVGTCAVTPPPGYLMDGYVDRDGLATGTRDQLEVNLVALSDGEVSVLWLSLDAIAISASLRNLLVRTIIASAGFPIDPERVICAASHTHSGPAGWSGQIHPVLPADEDAHLRQSLAAHVAKAVKNLTLVPVELRWSETVVTGGGSNRHKIDGPHDKSLGALTLISGTKPCAVVFDYACHPTCLGPDNLQWSADWVGVARSRLRASYHNIPVVFLQGAAGDVSSRLVRGDSTEPDLMIGAAVGDALRSVIGDGDIVRGRLTLTRETVSLPRRRIPVEPMLPPAGDQLSSTRRVALKSQAALVNQLDKPIEIPLSIVQIGKRAWLNLGVELFASYGLALKRGHPGLRVVGYCDSYGGYAPDRDAYGNSEYEAMAAFIDLDATTLLIENAHALVESQVRT